MKKTTLTLISLFAFFAVFCNQPTKNRTETAKSESSFEKVEETICEIETLSQFPLIGNTIGFVMFLDRGLAEIDRLNKVEILNDDGTIWHSFYVGGCVSDFVGNNELFRPFAFEFFVLAMRCIAKSEHYYTVVVNEEKNLVKRMRRHSEFGFQTVEQHVLRLVGTDFRINPIRTYPNDDAPIVHEEWYKYEDFLIMAIEAEGDWIKIIDAWEDEILGWIRWRKDDRFMVWLFYSI